MTRQAYSKKTEDRQPSDFYPTPQALASAVVAYLERANLVSPTAMDILEPSAGEGPFVRACDATFPRARLIAVEPRVEPALVALRQTRGITLRTMTIEDYCIQNPTTKFDLIVGNPPFSLAASHIEWLRPKLKSAGTLAFLLKLGFFGTKSRVKFWTDNPPSGIIPIVPRPSFVNGGTDSQEYALFIWQESIPQFIAAPLVWR